MRGNTPLLNENPSGMYVAKAQEDAYEFHTLRSETNRWISISQYRRKTSEAMNAA